MPLSPHLPIYRVQITSLLSILHRLSEMVVYGLSCLAVLFMTFLVFKITWLQWIATHGSLVVGLFFMISFTAWIGFHSLSGLRYIAWDLGWGFSVPWVNRTGWAAVLGTGLCLVGVLIRFYHFIQHSF